MNIVLAITFISRGIRVQRSGSFNKRGRTPERVAIDCIQEIKKEMDVEGLLSVIVDGKEDITVKVIKLLKAHLDD
ncbi:hypothetical protein M3204_03390 [Mesobacillus subterraneus]|uniref:hypothetical protein n=1 Tax=Mesobacillus subterraneus TaxID=285983 RepID=UPI00203BD72E|nr:hypothetical protein [Mesobacillus subterraneus]MCM3663434.1 hypothetical protein [Mesobacillus subterraneus]MCM3683204.1 hypothetical protein [Mesobacillus subterraneus]